MTATTEKPVVSKQAQVVEEVALSKQSGQRDEMDPESETGGYARVLLL